MNFPFNDDADAYSENEPAYPDYPDDVENDATQELDFYRDQGAEDERRRAEFYECPGEYDDGEDFFEKDLDEYDDEDPYDPLAPAPEDDEDDAEEA